MKASRLCNGVLGLCSLVMGCSYVPGRPRSDAEIVRPDEVRDFSRLYAQNCSGCHGRDGMNGPAIALANPTYQAIVDDDTLRTTITDGEAGALMPAFAQSAGGMLTDKQIDTIAGGIRDHWSKPDALRGAVPPPYSSAESADRSRGAEVYVTHCQSCHGVGGRGGQGASSIVDGSFLALLSNQELRTIVIVGRPELGAPDWRGDLPGKPLSEEDVSDVVAWLASQRPQFPGQPYTGSDKSTGETP
jgi:mono/diheme cytochrome c family protein